MCFKFWKKSLLPFKSWKILIPFLYSKSYSFLCLHLLKMQFLVSSGIDETVSGVCGRFVLFSVPHGKGQVLLWFKVQTWTQLSCSSCLCTHSGFAVLISPCARLFRSSRMVRTCSNEMPFVSCQVKALPLAFMTMNELLYSGIQTLFSL